MFSVSFKTPPSLHRFLDCLKPGSRRLLYSAAAAAVSNLVRRHIAADAPRRHNSASRLGATPTGFQEKAARGTVHHSDETHGEVVIPSPGFGRAFHDVEIVPTHGAALTLPISEFSYGRRVSEMRSLGWIIFRPRGKGDIKGKDILFGAQGKDNDSQFIPLYILKKRVRQRQDRTLLPSDAAISTTASRAMITTLQNIARKAGQ